VKEIEINQKSWHYWIANHMGGKRRVERKKYKTIDGEEHFAGFKWEDNDFCSYVRRVLIGLFWLAPLAAIASLILCAMGSALFFYGRWLFNHKLEMHDFQLLGTVFWFFAIIFSVIIVAIRFLNAKLEARRKMAAAKFRNVKAPPKRKKGDPFIRMAYRALKDRVCFKMVVK
jgi:hypothetical protein